MGHAVIACFATLGRTSGSAHLIIGKQLSMVPGSPGHPWPIATRAIRGARPAGRRSLPRT